MVLDLKRVIYEKIARLFFEIHDPTEVNCQGPDALVAAWKDRLCRGAKMEEALTDEESPAKEAAAAAVSCVRCMVTLAKAEVYASTDRLEQAKAVIDAAAR